MTRFSLLVTILTLLSPALQAQGDWAAGTRLRGELIVNYGQAPRGTPYVQFSPDGRWLGIEEYAEDGPGATRIFDLSTMERVCSLPGLHWFSADGQFAVYQDEDDAVVHRLPDGELVGRYHGVLAEEPFSADSRYLLTRTDEGTGLGLYALGERPGEGATEFRAMGDGSVFELPSGRMVGEIGGDQWYDRVLPQLRGRTLVGDGETISLYDLPTQRLLSVWRGQWANFVGPRGDYVLLGWYEVIDEDQDQLQYELRRVEDGAVVWTTTTAVYGGANVSIDPQARWAVVTDLPADRNEAEDGLVTSIYDVASGERIVEQPIYAPRLSPDGNFLVDGLSGETSPLLALPELELIEDVRGWEGQFAPDGQTLITFGDGRIYVWEPNDGVG